MFKVSRGDSGMYLAAGDAVARFLNNTNPLGDQFAGICRYR